LEIEEFPQAKEVTDVRFQDQNNVDCFFDIRITIHSANQTFYVQVLKRHIDTVRRKRGELWRDHSLILHHNNKSAYSSLRVLQSLAGNGISTMDHPPFSADLAPELKRVLKRKRFSGTEDIK
jgi:transposase InsO family protein